MKVSLLLNREQREKLVELLKNTAFAPESTPPDWAIALEFDASGAREIDTHTLCEEIK